ncbi:MAG TPA: bifunctional (p)ppGpp synthetase/guanosine-3',5'-bis(diphosphate) 3'-pyrophosphohydrolase [bacterium]|nr:bifunctional (p)ppGpp synthetase/guanosine-3',5'-bis(diphosphate) 3'-pyrophosphohydrolase [bacterium]
MSAEQPGGAKAPGPADVVAGAMKRLHLVRGNAEEALPEDAEALLRHVRETIPHADRDLIRRAYLFAEAAHAGQTRASNEPYVHHAVAVADILVGLRLDSATIAAALLHDVPEDTAHPIEEIKAKFGPEIAGLVDGVTKLGRIEWKTREERQAENLRKMFLAMASDIRIILIKLADRVHNMRTIEFLPEWKQKRTARETLEIYAPLTERLGIGSIKRELEDRAFRVLEPGAHTEIAGQLERSSQEQDALLARVVATLHTELGRAGIRVDRGAITARPKHVYSIYQKMQRPKYQGQGVGRIYDRLAVRVVVNDVRECYETLGIVHALWKPIPGEVDDYIANPKTSGYQSLHTAVLYEGQPLEIQIRTQQMHRVAEHGIAAHWRYKEGGGKGEPAFEQKLSWLRQLLEWHQELQDAREFMHSVKIDLFQNEVFVFTPKGDVIDLPSGATPVDFAFRVHTDVGYHTTGARVNGRLVPLSHPLQSGDIVEVVTNKNSAGPSRDWLAFVQTSNARTKIRQWFKRERRDENIVRGKEVLEKELRRGGSVAALMKPDRLREVAARFSLPNEDELYAALGNGDVSLLHVVQALRGAPAVEEEQAPLPPAAPPAATTARGIRVRGVDNVLMRFGRCCSPLPGDRVVGYITRGRGVSIHRADCPNIQFLRSQPERLLEVEWEASPDGTYKVEIEVEALDRVGMLKDILGAITETKTNLVSVNARVRKDKVAVVSIVADIGNVTQLTAVMHRIGRVKDVYNVERVVPH